MTLPKYSERITLHDAMQQFDNALADLVRDSDYKSAVNANIASMRWIDALYCFNEYYEGIPDGFANEYRGKIDLALGMIVPLKRMAERHYKELEKKLKTCTTEEKSRLQEQIEHFKHEHTNLNSCAVQMRSRKTLVAKLVPKTPDHLG